ncbi:MAG: DNA polymerase I, partial [uncultured bacterium]
MTNNKKTKKLILIDGNAIIHRAYHALPPFTTKKGELVNAVYGFSSTLLNIISEFKPDYVVASFDLAGPTFRHEQFEHYKATRVKGDDELYAQIPRVKEVVKAFNIPIYEKAGFEA